jgi:MraZ protein
LKISHEVVYYPTSSHEVVDRGKQMALFVGEFDQALDEKRRIAIPAPLRDQIDAATDGEGFFLVLGTKRHLWLYPDKYYRGLTATLKRSPLPTRSGEKMGLFFAMARYVEPDKQGRIVLPEKSIQRAVVGEQVTLVGHDDHIEVWPREEWDRHLQEQLPSYDDAILEMGEKLSGVDLPPP